MVRIEIPSVTDEQATNAIEFLNWKSANWPCVQNDEPTTVDLCESNAIQLLSKYFMLALEGANTCDHR